MPTGKQRNGNLGFALYEGFRLTAVFQQFPELELDFLS